jgi:uncharacterized membrane protein YbhN (UPF0104 family)
MRFRRAARAVVIAGALAVSALFTYLAFRHVDWAQFRDAFEQSNFWWLVPAAAVLAVGVFLRAVRWRLLFPPQSRPALGAVTRALLVGTFFNNVLPARPGEAIRVVTLHQETGTSRAAALATAVTERVYDVGVLLFLLFIAVPWLPEVTWLRRVALVAVVLTAVLAAGIAALARWEDAPVAFLLRPFRRVPAFTQDRIDLLAANVVEGFAAVRRVGIALPALALSFVAILVIAFSYWLVAFAMHLHVGFGAAVLVMVAVNFAMVIPGTPGALGVFEAATVVALHPFGVDRADALSYGIVLHALNSLPFIAIGFVLLHRHGVRALRAPK